MNAAGGSSPSLLTYSEAADRLRVSLRQFHRIVASGKIPFIQVAERSPRIRNTDIEAFLLRNLGTRGGN